MSMSMSMSITLAIEVEICTDLFIGDCTVSSPGRKVTNNYHGQDEKEKFQVQSSTIDAPLWAEGIISIYRFTVDRRRNIVERLQKGKIPRC